MTPRSGKAARRYDPSEARARAIRQAREWAWMSEQDLARTLGVSRWTVRCWEAAVRDPGPGMTARIALATRAPVSSLLAPRPAGWRYEAERRNAPSPVSPDRASRNRDVLAEALRGEAA